MLNDMRFLVNPALMSLRILVFRFYKQTNRVLIFISLKFSVSNSSLPCLICLSVLTSGFLGRLSAT